MEKKCSKPRRKERYRRLVEKINSVIIKIDAEGRIRFINEFTEKLFGFSRNELIGKNLVGTILPETDGEGGDNTGLVAEMIREPERFYFNQSAGLGKDGKEVYFSWSARKVKDPETKEPAILIDGNDITAEYEARRQAQNALKIINSSKNPIIRLDSRKKCLFANFAFAGMAGKRVEEIEGGFLAGTGLPDSTLKKLDEAFEEAAQSRRDQFVESEIKDRYTMMRVEPEFDGKNAFSGVIVFGGDITARRRVEKALEHLNATLERRVEERTALAESRAKQLQKLAVDLIGAEEKERQKISDLLHDDLQQLLAGAWMQVQILLQAQPSIGKLNELEGTLKESIQKSRELAHDLTPPVLKHSDLVTAVEWLARRTEEKFGLRVRLETRMEEKFSGTPAKTFLFRAVRELLFNVVKHAKVKSAEVVLSGSVYGLSVAVADRGRGFDPRILSSGEGAGLGLASMRERARYMGGDLKVESAPGKGSCITLKIPEKFADKSETNKLGAGSEMEPAAEEPGGTVEQPATRVVFADDHEVIRHGLAGLFANQPDIRVEGQASDGEEALELTRKLVPDVLVIDVSMPKMNGIEATRRIKADLPQVRVIGLSMHDDELMEKAMLEAGAEALVSKASSSADLLNAIYRNG